MDDPDPHAITLSAEQARIIREHMATGEYDTARDVIDAALLSLLLIEKQEAEVFSDGLLKRLVEEARRDAAGNSPQDARERVLEQHRQQLAGRASARRRS